MGFDEPCLRLADERHLGLFPERDEGAEEFHCAVVVEDKEPGDEDKGVVDPVDEDWVLSQHHTRSHQSWTADDEDDSDDPESAVTITDWD